MNNSAGEYFAELSRRGGAAWNHFWFEPSHPATASALRIVAGLASLYYLLTASFDLTAWLAGDGLLPNAVMLTAMQERADQIPNFRFSLLYFLNEPAVLWIFHGLSIAIAAAFAAGLASRVTNLLTLGVILSWVHRAPLITWQFEPVLTMVLLYLCLAPTGACYSLDRWFKARRGQSLVPPQRSWLATIAVRLIQVHLCMFYLLFALSKLAGEVWWVGNAVYLLSAQSESRLLDLSWLRGSIFAFNAWTHSIVLLELAYVVMIWNRLLRPLAMAGSVVLWLGVAVLTGLLDFALLMLLLNVAFVPGAWLNACCGEKTAAATAEAELSRAG